MKKTMLRFPFIVMATMVLAGFLLLTACGGNSGSGSAGASKEEAKQMTEEEVADWLSGGSGYKNRKATVTGKVFNLERNNKEAVYQIQTDPANYSGNTVIYWEGEDLGINRDAYIRATGIVADDFKGKNAFGADITATCLKADTIEEISYVEAVSPTIASIEPAVSSEYNGYKVTVDKVEFADAETRVYVTVTNNGAGKLSVYDYNAVIIQDGKQFNTEHNFAADYPDINKQVAAGATIEGIVAFPAIEQKDFQIQMNGSSDNYSADGGSFDFSFDITV